VLAVVTASVIGTVFPLLVVLFTVASRGWVAVSILCAAAAMFGNLLLQPERTLWVTRSYGPLLLLAVALVLGMWARSRRRLVVPLAEQVDHLRWSASCAPSAPRWRNVPGSPPRCTTCWRTA
jgi:uncharacterized membrane protein